MASITRQHMEHIAYSWAMCQADVKFTKEQEEAVTAMLTTFFRTYNADFDERRFTDRVHSHLERIIRDQWHRSG